MIGLLWLAFLVLMGLWIVGLVIDWGVFIWALFAIAIIVLIGNLFASLRYRRWC